MSGTALRLSLVTSAAWLGLMSPGLARGDERPAASAEAFAPLPQGFDDFEHRVIGRFDINVAPVVTNLTNTTNPIGIQQTADTLRSGSTYLEGGVALGTRSLLLPTLNTYGLGTGVFDLAGVPTIDAPLSPAQTAFRPAAQPSVYDRFPGGRALLLHLGYGELDGITQDGALAHFKLRAGRQFHYGVAGVTFDGATAGYDDGELEIMGRIGQRSAVFDRTQPHPGFIAGGDVRYRREIGANGTFDAGLEFIHFERDIALLGRDQLVLGDVPATLHTSDNVGELRVNMYSGSDLGLWGRLSYVNPDISHGRLGAEWSSGMLSILVAFDEKIGKDLIYDLATSNGATIQGRPSTYEIFRLNIPNLRPYSEVDLTVALEPLDWLELDFRPGGRVVHGDTSERSAFDADHLLLGGGAYGRFKIGSESGLETALDYDGLFYSRSGPAGDIRAMGGESQSHTVSASIRWLQGDRFIHGRLLGSQRFALGLGGFIRISRFDTTLTPAFTESIVGGRADVRWNFSKFASTHLAYEYALDSNVFDPQFGGFHLLRAGVEARF